MLLVRLRDASCALHVVRLCVLFLLCATISFYDGLLELGSLGAWELEQEGGWFAVSKLFRTYVTYVRRPFSNRVYLVDRVSSYLTTHYLNVIMNK